MTSPSFAWFYEDPFHSIFSASTTALSVLSNGLLLHVIFTTNSSAIGSYRYLRAVFAVCDILTNPCDTIFCLIFVATYYQTFLILANHYVYRRKTVTSNISCSFTDHWKMSTWVSLAVIVNILYIIAIIPTCISFMPSDATRALVPPEIFEIYGADLQDVNRGFAVVAIRHPDLISGVLEWHTPTIITLMMLVGEFGGTSIIIVFCIWRITRVIRSSDNHFTVKTRKMQMNLFRALLIQTAVPILFSYIPLGIIIIFPAVTGISLGAFVNVLFSITSIFPCIDALFVLFFIGKFRIDVIRLFRLPFNTEFGSSVEQRSTAR